MGLLGIIFPVEYGGAGLGYVEYVVALEELARVDGSVALTVSAHTSLCTNHIYQFGHEEQRRRYVPALARGEKLGCWSLTEPRGGFRRGRDAQRGPASRRRLVARRSEDVHDHRPSRRRLRGHGRDGPREGPQGISAFILEIPHRQRTHDEAVEDRRTATYWRRSRARACRW